MKYNLKPKMCLLLLLLLLNQIIYENIFSDSQVQFLYNIKNAITECGNSLIWPRKFCSCAGICTEQTCFNLSNFEYMKELYFIELYDEIKIIRKILFMTIKA